MLIQSGRRVIMKFLNILFFFSIGLNIYFLTKDDKEPMIIETQDEVSFKRSALSKIRKKSRTQPLRSKLRAKMKKQQEAHRYPEEHSFANEEQWPMPDEGLSINEQTKIQALWDVDIEEYFEYELNLSPTEIEEYKKLSKDREREISSYISSLMNERGEEGSTFFALTMDEMIGMSEINKAYLHRLEQFIGRENFKAYKNFKNEYNSSISGKHKNGQFYIDF